MPKLRRILSFLLVSAILILCIAIMIQGTVEKLSSEITPWNFFQHISVLELFLWSCLVYGIGILIAFLLAKLGK
jgi:TRAP-type C4-dicarboxylate transport system permease small subunit